MTINFNGGTHDVAIFKEGIRYDRTNLPYFFNSITAVEMKLSRGQYASIKVTIEPSFDDAIRILSSGLLGIGMSSFGQAPKAQQGPDGQAGAGSAQTVTAQPISGQTSQPAAGGAGNDSKDGFGEGVAAYIAVKFLYPGQLDSDGSAAETPWFTGPVYSPHLEISDQTISITMVAQCTAAFLKLIQGTSTFKNEPALDVIKKLAKSVNVQITFEKGDTETEALLTSTKVSGIYNEPKMQTIRNILYKLDCYWSTPSGTGKEAISEIRIIARKRISQSPLAFSFVMFRQIDPGNNVIPIYSLSLESGGVLFLKQGAFGSFQRAVLEGKKKVQQIAFNPKDFEGSSMTGTGVAGGSLPKSGPVFGGSAGVSNDADPELTGSSTPGYSRGEDNNNIKDIKASSQRAIFDGIAYRLTLPGLPRLSVCGPAQVIVGDFIPGLSAVGWTESVIHKSDSSGWTSDVVFRQTGGAIDKAVVSNFNNKEVEAIPQKAESDSKTAIPIE